jgi:tight adherence protein B
VETLIFISKSAALNIYLRSGIYGILIALLVLILTRSLVIAVTFMFLATSISIVILKRTNSKRYDAMNAAWPEVIDHLITGIQSGLSINESLAGLANRGPQILRPIFRDFALTMSKSGDFTAALNKVKHDCGQPGGDQIFESISISRALGGSELLTILRTVGTFLRQDLALRREIEVKHGWIKNSAHLSAAAPWVLLLLLSTQPATAQAFSTTSGAFVLTFGVAMTAVAYIWMAKLGQLPTVPRVFGER